MAHARLPLRFAKPPNRLPSEEDLLSANRVAHRISITLHQEAVETLTPGTQITSGTTHTHNAFVARVV